MVFQQPYPWFGGKATVVDLVWSRFGDTPNYVEPFFGGGAMLLNRPHWPFDSNRAETINDIDCYVANFWRALHADTEAVINWTDWPVNEADLHARHWWLVNQHDFRERMRTDPDYHDAKIAGWWVWGVCQWIGSGWCDVKIQGEGPSQQLPHLGDAGRGVHRPSQQLPHLGDAGRGVHRPSQQRPHLLSGMGVHRPSQQLPLREYLFALADRMRGVRVCCGDWSRVLGPTPTEKLGLTAVFLDPPYSVEDREHLYSEENFTVAHDVREWAIANGDNPKLRIALCGYDDEHAMPEDWECVEWKSAAGYSAQRTNGVNNNRHRERIWFSPHCLKPETHRQLSLMEIG